MNNEPPSAESDQRPVDSKTSSVRPGVGVAWPLFFLIVCLAVLGVVGVGWVSHWAPASSLGSILGCGLVISAVSAYSQRDLIRFRHERGRWPTEEELGLWNQEMHARREKARRVARAKSGARGAENEFRRNVAAAEGVLKAAERRRQEEISSRRAVLATAQEMHARAVADATAGLEAWRNPGLGALLARFEGIALHAHGLITARSQLPLVGAQAIVTAKSVVIQAGGTSEETRLKKEQIPAAQQFAAHVTAAAAAELSFQQQRPTAIHQAEQHLARSVADTAATEAAQRSLVAVESDQSLLAAIEEAKAALLRARADTTEMEVTKAHLEAQQQSAVEHREDVPPPSWEPHTSNAVVMFVGIALVIVIAAAAGTYATNGSNEAVSVTSATATPTGSTDSSASLSPASPSLPPEVPSAPPSTTPATPTPTPPASAATPVPAVAPVIRFGATDADWNAHHTADPDFATGAVYDTDPSLPSINGHTGARYVTVGHTHGHILNYAMNLPLGTTVEAAKATAMKEFPGDASIVWFKVKSSCAQMEVQSSSLGQTLSDPAIGDGAGMAVVELDTEHPDGTAGYDPKNINELILSLGSYRSADDAPAC